MCPLVDTVNVEAAQPDRDPSAIHARADKRGLMTLAADKTITASLLGRIRPGRGCTSI
jgi:hypothetical protein